MLGLNSQFGFLNLKTFVYSVKPKVLNREKCECVKYMAWDKMIEARVLLEFVSAPSEMVIGFVARCFGSELLQQQASSLQGQKQRMQLHPAA